MVAYALHWQDRTIYQHHGAPILVDLGTAMEVMIFLVSIVELVAHSPIVLSGSGGR